MKKTITALFLIPTFLISAFLISTASLTAQKSDTTIDSTINKWTTKGVTSFNISQIAFSDWVQGGENALTYSAVGNIILNYKAEKWDFNNSLKITYGQTKVGDGGFRINDNELYLDDVYVRKFGWAVDPYVSNIVRTGIAPGYRYEENTARQISEFFDPGYISQSIGFTYDNVNYFKTRVGIGLQETFSSKFTEFTDDPNTKNIENFKLDTGIESVTDFDVNFMENMLYKGNLRLFSRFDKLDVWDLRWDNSITAQVNKYIVVNLTWLIIHQTSQSLRTQLKQALQIGITYNLF